ncbi:hypothetical protein [Ectobacillus panaciterrae]|uniref:hypothetical protein n=1 Tax=Ectobacillus panaciterrae TaxID=363872 RepID=UPI00040AAAD8
MEHYIQSYSFPGGPITLNVSQGYACQFNLNEPGEVILDVIASVPNGDWAIRGKESAFVTIYVDGNYNQDFIFYYGAEQFLYQRLLGRLEAGEHKITFLFKEEHSSAEIKEACFHKVEVRQIKDKDPDSIFYRHTPLIYGRNVSHPYESTFTDTPLLIYYYCDQHDDMSMTLEYHVIFSHEDWGTTAPALMSKWGRTTDIEWVYRVRIDAVGNIVEDERKIEEFQGPEHVTTIFRGSRELGQHPVLQAKTLNGNVSDDISSNYRYMLRPAVRLSRKVNREAVMNMFLWTYRVTAKEMFRQEALEQLSNPQNPFLADQRNYLFLQVARHSVNGNHRIGRIDIRVKLTEDKQIYTSIDGYPELAYESVDGPFSTTVKLPQGATIEQIENITACYVPIEEAAEDYRIVIPGIRTAFFLGNDFMPIRPMITSTRIVEISEKQPEAILWERVK